MKFPLSFPSSLPPFSLSKLGRLYASLSLCPSTCPPFIKMNTSASLVPESRCSTWHRLALLTSATSHQLHSFKLFFVASFSFFPCSFLWNNHVLARTGLARFSGFRWKTSLRGADTPAKRSAVHARCCLLAATLSTQPESLRPRRLFIARWHNWQTRVKR